MRTKKIAIMQPYIFPYIGYWQLINAVDTFIVLDDVNYIKKGWINRNSILVSGKSNLFTLPLVGASQNKKINKIDLLHEDKWKVKILKTIKNSYSKSPYFTTVFPLLEKIIHFKNVNLSEYLIYQLEEICKFLDIDTVIKSSSKIFDNQNYKGEEKIINICEKEKATLYINPIGGKDLYHKNSFSEKKVELFFLESKEINYKQFKNDFIPWLSIIDLLMFNSVEEIKTIFLTNYNLS